MNFEFVRMCGNLGAKPFAPIPAQKVAAEATAKTNICQGKAVSTNNDKSTDSKENSSKLTIGGQDIIIHTRNFFALAHFPIFTPIFFSNFPS